jgi:hypothetical protein
MNNTAASAAKARENQQGNTKPKEEQDVKIENVKMEPEDNLSLVEMARLHRLGNTPSPTVKKEPVDADVTIAPQASTAATSNQYTGPYGGIPEGPRDHLFYALAALRLAGSAEDAVMLMRLGPETADEEALKQLARKSAVFVPALAELRRKAIDRAVLQSLVEVKEEETDGESSAYEFELSDGEDAQKTESPLVLPAGWFTDVVVRNGRQFREFVDPTGRRYTTVAQAKHAVDSARSSDNMAQQLRAKYVARLAAIAANTASAVADAADAGASEEPALALAAGDKDAPALVAAAA